MAKSVSIYVVQKSLYNTTFPRIILKILKENKRGYILCKNKDEMKELDDLLWTFSQLSFLPHATEEDEYQKEQNLLITTKHIDDDLYDKFLILTSEDLFLKEYISKHTRLFIITTQPTNIQKFINNTGIKSDEVQIKCFIQNYDTSWA